LGHPGHSIYSTSSKKIQKKLLDNYFNLLKQLESVSIEGKYGQLISDSRERIQTKKWGEYIESKLKGTLKRAIQKPDHDIANLNQLFEKFFKEELPKLNDRVPKHLVHGDLFLENIMANNQGEVTGLLDFGSLTLLGDRLLDVATLTYAVTISDGVNEVAEEYLLEKTFGNYPDDMEMIRIYTLYYCLFFINNLTHDPRTYRWCIKNLKRLGYIQILSSSPQPTPY
jgi:fructosamine-3-kinase